MASPRMSDAAFALFRVAVHDGKDAVTLEVLSKAMISGSAYGEQNVYAYPTRLPACSFTVGRTRSVDTNTPQGKNTHAILRHMLGCQGVIVVVMKSGVSLNCCCYYGLSRRDDVTESVPLRSEIDLAKMV